MRKIFCLVLTLALALGTVGALAQTDAWHPFPGKAFEPESQDIIELHTIKQYRTSDRYLEGESMDDNYVLRAIEEMLNVNVVFDAAAVFESYFEKINLVMASGDLPDAMVVNGQQLKQLYEADMLVDMTDVYNEFVCDNLRIAYEGSIARGVSVFDGCTYDGRIYGIPSVDCTENSIPMIFIRTDWLEQCGIEKPDTLTMDKLKEIITAFKGMGKKGMVATSNFIPSNGGSNFGDMSGLFAMSNSYPEYFYTNEAGELVYGSVQPETKNALAVMRDFIAEGYLEKEFALYTSDEMIELASNGSTGVVAAYLWFYSNTINEGDDEVKWQSYLWPQDASGKVNITSMNPTGDYYVVVTKGFEHPETVMKIMNTQYELQADQGYTGIMDHTGYKPGAQFTYRFAAFSQTMCGDKWVFGKNAVDAYAADITSHEGMDGLTISTFDAYKTVMDQGGKTTGLSKTDMCNYANHKLGGYDTYKLHEGDINWIAAPTFVVTDAEELRWATLKKMEEETFTQIVLGEKDLDAFDAFVEQWYNLGGSDILSEKAALIAG